MSDEKKYTERDMVLAQREAYVVGRGDQARGAYYMITREEAAQTHYPLPKVTRPRVVGDAVDPHYEWSVVEGRLAFRYNRAAPLGKDRVGPWIFADDRGHGMGVTEKRARLVADLLANPTEEVEA